MTTKFKVQFVLFAICLFFFACGGGDDESSEMEMEMEEELTIFSACKYAISFGSEQLEEDGADGEPSCSVTSSGSSDNIGSYLVPGGYLADFDSGAGLYLLKGKFRTTTFGELPSNADFENHFAVGSYDFSQGDEDDGIEIEYLTLASEEWSSAYGNQDGSTFTITEMVSGEAQGAFFVNIRAEYNCKLYTEAGAVKNSSGNLTFQFKNF